MTCPECQSDNKTMARYCVNCGAQLRQQEDPRRRTSVIAFFLALFSTSFFYQIFPLPLLSASYWAVLFESHWICKLITFCSFWAFFILIRFSIQSRRQSRSFSAILKQIPRSNQLSLASLKANLVEFNYQKYFNHPLYRIFHRIQSSPSDHSLLNSIVESENYRLELNYNLIKFFIWVIPILGFIGTVAGIADAVNQFSSFVQNLKGLQELSQEMKIALGGVTRGLATAFNTTFLALLMIVPLMFLNNIFQKKEEELLLDIEEYLTAPRPSPAPTAKRKVKHIF